MSVKGVYLNNFKKAKLVLGAVLCLFCSLALLAFAQYKLKTQELEKQSEALYVMVSQRAGQHDAHLTALSAVVVSSGYTIDPLFEEISQTILQFYPSIRGIYLISQQGIKEEVGARVLEAGQREQLIRLGLDVANTETVFPLLAQSSEYVLLKRNRRLQELGYGLVLLIDAKGMLDKVDEFWFQLGDEAINLSLPNGQSLIGSGLGKDNILFIKQLDSSTQPLFLETGMKIALYDLLPFWLAFGVSGFVAVCYGGGVLVWRQRQRLRATVEQAQLSALESRFAHAARVNTLGEMASGLAHELTQPLTAILAQAQAGRRLLQLGDRQRLATALDDTVTQAQRASAILGRLRAWVQPQQMTSTPFDLQQTLSNVLLLLDRDINELQIEVSLQVSNAALVVYANPVEIEQVIFNLVRNAMDALQDITQTRRMTINAYQQENTVHIEVIDNGPGVPIELQDNLFSPFKTSRETGMGLGLVLSQRLVERAGGELLLVDTPKPGAFFRVSFPSAQQD